MLCRAIVSSILRQTADGKCTLIGETFLHGRIQGETVTKESKERIEQEGG